MEGDLCSASYYADYKLDEVLTAGMSSVAELEKLVSDKLFFGYPIRWNGEWATEWSVVYHLQNFAVDVCNDMNYGAIREAVMESRACPRVKRARPLSRSIGGAACFAYCMV